MKKNIKKICIFLVVLCVTILCNVNAVNAVKVTETEPSKWDVSNFAYFDTDKGEAGKVGESTKNVVGTIINVIRIVGTGTAIVMLTYVAIKYMSAAPSEKAEFKKSATAYIVGAIVLFATTNILSIISNFATTNVAK